MSEWLCNNIVARIFFGHRWRYFSDGYKRECLRCGREDMMVRRPIDSLFRPTLFWRQIWPLPKFPSPPEQS